MARTIANAFTAARRILQDMDGDRYSDEALFVAFNQAMTEVRAKRPDLFLTIGLRAGIPVYDDAAADFPIDEMYFQSVVYYVAGMIDMGESVNGDNGRAVALMNKFASQLTGVAA